MTAEGDARAGLCQRRVAWEAPEDRLWLREGEDHWGRLQAAGRQDSPDEQSLKGQPAASPHCMDNRPKGKMRHLLLLLGQLLRQLLRHFGHLGHHLCFNAADVEPSAVPS